MAATTIDQLKRLIRGLYTKRDRLIDQATVYQAEIDKLQLVVDEMELRDQTRLPDPIKARMLAEKMAQPALKESPAFWRRGRPTISRHPFPRALEAREITVKQWADANGIDRAKVRTWFAPIGQARRIPRKVAEQIRDELGVSLDSWPKGIKE